LFLLLFIFIRESFSRDIYRFMQKAIALPVCQVKNLFFITRTISKRTLTYTGLRFNTLYKWRKYLEWIIETQRLWNRTYLICQITLSDQTLLISRSFGRKLIHKSNCFAVVVHQLCHIFSALLKSLFMKAYNWAFINL
jgi:hypothetical protein